MERPDMKLTHLPTGISVTSTGRGSALRSMHKARLAMTRVLKAKVAAVHRGEWTTDREHALDLKPGEISPVEGWSVVREYDFGDWDPGFNGSQARDNPLLQGATIKDGNGDVLASNSDVLDVLDGELEKLRPKKPA